MKNEDKKRKESEGNVRIEVEGQGSCGVRRNVSESVDESWTWMSRRERGKECTYSR